MAAWPLLIRTRSGSTRSSPWVSSRSGEVPPDRPAITAWGSTRGLSLKGDGIMLLRLLCCRFRHALGVPLCRGVPGPHVALAAHTGAVDAMVRGAALADLAAAEELADVVVGLAHQVIGVMRPS